MKKRNSPRRKSAETDRRGYAQDGDYRASVENIKEYAIFILDKKGKILSWDQGAIKQFGYKRSEIVGKPYSVLFTARDRKMGVPASDLRAALRHGTYLDERQYVRKNGTTYWSSDVLTSTRDKAGENQGFSKIMRNVSDEIELQKVIIHRSTHDYLTGLPNRRFFQELLVGALRETESDRVTGLLYLDFNNFKTINDREGHRAGDLILIEIANILRKTVRRSDIVARMGGDEFVILVRDARGVQNLRTIAGKIVRSFLISMKVGPRLLKTSVSVGGAIYPKDAKTPAKLLHCADMALYEAKKLGGKQYRFFRKGGVKLLRTNRH